jgi:hypothetical protein
MIMTYIQVLSKVLCRLGVHYELPTPSKVISPMILCELCMHMAYTIQTRDLPFSMTPPYVSPILTTYSTNGDYPLWNRLIVDRR